MEAVSKSEMLRELVIPEFRKFCRLNGLNFHFVDEMAEAKPSFRLIEGEQPLKVEAMALFDKLKPEYSLHKEHVVSYRFNCLDGDFDYTAQPVRDFLVKAAEDRKRLELLEKWLEVLCDVLALSVGLICMVFLARWFKWAGGWLSWIVLLSVVIGGGMSWRWFLNTRPRRLKEQARLSFLRELEELRNKLDSAHKGLDHPTD